MFPRILPRWHCGQRLLDDVGPEKSCMALLTGSHPGGTTSTTMGKGSNATEEVGLPRLDPSAHVHLMGICGTGMASLAGMFHERGFLVTGSDESVYPPMSDFLKELGIEVKEGYHASNLNPRPDLVVVGNVIRRTNPEAIALEQSSIRFTTMPAALTHYFAHDKVRVVVAGTHGKTTVSSMIAWILHHEGLDPSFMIGGLPQNFGANYRLGQGRHFVIEGDEYDTAYFEKTPKMLHYRPHAGVITSCEFDHADIYESLDAIKDQFRAFAGLIPADGFLAACWDDRNVRQVLDPQPARLETYGLGDSAKWSVANVGESVEEISAEIRRYGRTMGLMALPLTGVHNLLNGLAAIVVTSNLGVDPEKAAAALASFRGVKRRQEILYDESGIILMDDFAHHPTAVKVTCEGVRSRYRDRRVVAVFEPRSNTSRRAVFQSDYVPVFRSADLILLREPRGVDGIPPQDRFSSARLAQDLKKTGKNALSFDTTDEIIEFLLEELHYGDIVLVMSNGSFDNLNARVVAALKERWR